MALGFPNPLVNQVKYMNIQDEEHDLVEGEKKVWHEVYRTEIVVIALLIITVVALAIAPHAGQIP
jgi:hypothetical protein